MILTNWFPLDIETAKEVQNINMVHANCKHHFNIMHIKNKFFVEITFFLLIIFNWFNACVGLSSAYTYELNINAQLSLFIFWLFENSKKSDNEYWNIKFIFVIVMFSYNNMPYSTMFIDNSNVIIFCLRSEIALDRKNYFGLANWL